MAVNIEERRAQLDALNDFIENTQKKLTSILSILGWNAEKLREKSREMVTCPLNSEHYIPKDTLEKHLASCAWKMEGYHEHDIPLSESCGPDGSSIVIELRTAVIREAALQDPKMKTGISAVGLDDRPIPKTMDRIISDFTPDERRVLYDFAVSKTGAVPVVKVEELHMSFQKEEKQHPKTFLERLAEERDAKRRRVSKKVHTNRKSHTEILREVIQNQMELYEDILKQENEEIGSDDSRKNEETYDCDPKPKEYVNPSSVAHTSEKNVSRKERVGVDKEELKRREHSQSSRRTGLGRSNLIHEDRHRIEHVRWQRTSEYDRREGRISHRDRNSSTVHESSDRRNGNKHSHRRKRRRDKRKRRTHSSSDTSNSNDTEDFHRKRKRSRDAEVNISQHRGVSYRDTVASGRKDAGLKHEPCGSKTKEKSSSSLYKEDRKFTPKNDRSRDDESWYKLQEGGRNEFLRSYDEDDRTVYEEDNRQKACMKFDSSESRDSHCGDTKTKRQLAAHSRLRKYDWERRNSDSSDDDSGSESHSHVKNERRKEKRRRREETSPHKLCASEYSSNDVGAGSVYK
ncbi:splicing regulatory glutamine/lysine-rich protein 1-like isoform X2 [Zootermopsis nevadensis]|uniref:splicing regulatory glutamine/lysine-rich protein 1-like isoform X2 n=1 Tax=Zootermopsis nevadensis TaxID=136037 RepID=UPI000B8E5D9A|nr:splicing regulatory glutamine/lysine-rich protein 1-like isoform X2 [Zootermopsis nevadensis]